MNADAIALSPPGLMVAIGMAAVVAFTLLKLFWGMAQWARKSDFRLVEDRADVVEWSGREGYVRAGGELWRATSAEPLQPGERVRVARTRGLVLEVKKTTPPANGED
jgi:membrane-bound ClpP family serine protease